MTQSKLNLDRKKIDRARELSKQITRPVNDYIEQHTTVAIERATLRMLGADGVTADDVPVPNAIVNALGDNIQYGASTYYVNALLRKNLTVEQLNDAIADGLDISQLELTDMNLIRQKAEELVAAFAHRVKGNVAYRTSKITEYKEKENAPLLYLIVATGNIFEDVK